MVKAGELIRQRTGRHAAEGPEAYCVMALMDADEYPTASVITAADAEGIARVYFCTGLGSNKAERIRRCRKASVCFCHPTYSITLVGTVEVDTDPERKKAMWYAGLENHFSGPDDPAYCVLAFTTERYNLFVDWKEEVGIL